METDRMHPHLDDSALLHLVDEDADPMALDIWTRHVLACESCAGRLQARQHESTRVRVAISEVELPAGFPTAEMVMAAARASQASRPAAFSWARSSWTERPALRMAALVLLLLLPIALVSPLRAAMVELIREGWARVMGDPPPASDSVSRPGSSSDAGYTLWFIPASTELEVVIDRGQAAGELVLSRTPGSEGSLEVEAGGGEAVLTDAGIRIRNEVESSAGYRVALPPSVDRVTVRVGGGSPRLVTAEELDAGWSTELR